jgi:hypothetical protein
VLIKSYEEATHLEAAQLEDALLDLVSGGQFIWTGPGAPRSPKPTHGGPGAGDTIDTNIGYDANNLPSGGPGSGPWGN